MSTTPPGVSAALASTGGGGGVPDPHAASHQNGGSDEVAAAAAAANVIPKAGAGGELDKDFLPDMVASGASAAKGAVPVPPGVAGASLLLREDGTWALPADGVTAEPMGFPNVTDTSLAWDDGTTTFTLGKTGATFDVWLMSKKYTFSADQVLVGDGTDFVIAEGLWFFYFNSSGVLVASQAFWNLSITAPVAIIYWDAANSKALAGGVFDERHGVTMDWATHVLNHLTRHTEFQEGLSLTAPVDASGALDTSAKVAVSDGMLHDEDIIINIIDGAGGGRFEQELDPIAQLPVFYREGAGGLWREKTPNDYPLYEEADGIGSRIGWNDPDAGGVGVWGITEIGNNDFTDVIIVATNSFHQPVIAIVGQTDYTTLPSARDADPLLTMDLTGLPFQEMRFLYRIIAQTSNGYSNAVEARWRSPITDYRAVSQGSPASATLPTDHQALSNRAAEGAHPVSAVGLIPYQVKDGAGAQAIAGAFTVNLDTIMIDDVDQYVLDTDEIEILEAGTYQISFILTAEDIDASGGVQCNVSVWVDEDSAGWATVDGSYAEATHIETMDSSTSHTFLLTVAAGDSIRLRAARANGTTNIQTKADRTLVSIIKVA